MSIFPCTPGGAIRRGRRRLRALLAALVLVLLAAAAGAFLTRRVAPGVIALLLAAAPWLAWRAGTDSEVLRLELEGDELRLRMRYRLERVPIAGAAARRLSPQEIAHLEGLATLAGITGSSGGYESHLLGELELFASDLANAVLLEAGERRFVVTPDDPNAFLFALH